MRSGEVWGVGAKPCCLGVYYVLFSFEFVESKSSTAMHAIMVKWTNALEVRPDRQSSGPGVVSACMY